MRTTRRGLRLSRVLLPLMAMLALALPAGAQAASADLAISKADGPDPVREGDVLTYTLTVVNNGPGSAGAVTVTDKLLPSQVSSISASASQGTCSVKGKTVTCTLGALAIDPYAPGTPSATVTIQLKPTKVGQLTNTATVDVGSGDTDPNAANNSATATTTVIAAGGGGGTGATCSGHAATIVGTRGADTLRGTAARDVIKARGGRDVIRGLQGKDIVCAGGGNDLLRGGGGGDLLKGGSGRDVLKGGGGNDNLRGGPGRDRCRGGSGHDTKRSC